MSELYASDQSAMKALDDNAVTVDPVTITPLTGNTAANINVALASACTQINTLQSALAANSCIKVS